MFQIVYNCNCFNYIFCSKFHCLGKKMWFSYICRKWLDSVKHFSTHNTFLGNERLERGGERPEKIYLKTIVGVHTACIFNNPIFFRIVNGVLYDKIQISLSSGRRTCRRNTLKILLFSVVWETIIFWFTH